MFNQIQFYYLQTNKKLHLFTKEVKKKLHCEFAVKIAFFW